LKKQFLAPGLLHELFKWRPLIAGRFLQMEMLTGTDDLGAPRQSLPYIALYDDEMNGGIAEEIHLAHPSEAFVPRILLGLCPGCRIILTNAGDLIVLRVLHRLQLASGMTVPGPEDSRADYAWHGLRGERPKQTAACILEPLPAVCFCHFLKPQTKCE